MSMYKHWGLHISTNINYLGVVLVSWLGKMAKLLFIFLFLSSLFLLSWTYYRRECGKVSHHKYHRKKKSQHHITWMSHDQSHDRHGKIVHRPCSSYISSVENPIELSQTSFGHISINSLMILTVSKATKSPQKDLSIDASHISRRSIMAKILSRLTGNYYVTVY